MAVGKRAGEANANKADSPTMCDEGNNTSNHDSVYSLTSKAVTAPYK